MYTDLNERVTLQSLTTNTSDNAGGKTRVWSNSGDIWAAVTVLPLNEDIQGNALKTRSLYRIIVHGDTAISAEMRLIWRGKTLRISRIADVPPRALYKTLDCILSDTIG